MTTILADTPSIANRFLAELRDHTIQRDPLRFRRNLERLGEVLAYKISETLDYGEQEVETPLGSAAVALPQNKLVLATILRAGLPLHRGLLNYFDRAENAFVSAYRKHDRSGDFDIEMQYVTCPDLTGKVLVVADPMLATGASMAMVVQALLEHGKPSAIHIVAGIAARDGLDYCRRRLPKKCRYWIGAVDEELTARSYIVPGLGDAGDLAYGEKRQR